MTNPFYQNLDHLTFNAGDLQRILPIDATRLQMLVKRHFPTSDAYEQKGRKRSYSPRMIVWMALTSRLMDMGITVSTAADMTRFAFSGGLDLMFSRLAAGNDIPQMKRIARTYAVVHPAANGDNPHIGLIDTDKGAETLYTGGWSLMFPLGSYLMELGDRFNAGRDADQTPQVVWA